MTSRLGPLNVSATNTAYKLGQFGEPGGDPNSFTIFPLDRYELDFIAIVEVSSIQGSLRSNSNLIQQDG
jgi:hypothetical protein